MAKKQWITVKRGFVRDTKHRLAMGECVWLFLYMLDIADWDTGKIPEWKDEATAEDMGMPVRTLREQRRKLESLDYVLCVQKQYGQEITIMNWTNPREYSGEVYNKKQGDNKTALSNNAQGYTQGYTQGSSQDVTPTFNPKNQIPEKEIPKNMPIDWYIQHGHPVPQELIDSNKLTLAATSAFEENLGFGSLPWDSTSEWASFKRWVIRIHEEAPETWQNYAEWRAGKGKYDAMSNKQIRQNPKMFIDTGYPAFKAHTTMYKQEGRKTHGL